MSERKYMLNAPWGVAYQITKEQAIFLSRECEAIEAQPEERQWRDGDLMRNGRILRIRVQERWRIFGSPNGIPNDEGASDRNMGVPGDIYLGNLGDLLAQGPILVAVTEKELIQLIEAPIYGPLAATLASHLADYRERQRKKDGHE